MDDWLLAARNALAESANLSPDELDLEEADESILLELARLAADESGARTNAPLLATSSDALAAARASTRLPTPSRVCGFGRDRGRRTQRRPTSG